MKRIPKIMLLLMAFSLVLPGCSSINGLLSKGDDVLYVNLVWHQHQPLYFKDSDGVYTRPWVRVHATKDYYDMASTIAEYPGVHATINLTPVLLRQIDDFVENGVKDRYWVLAEKSADTLTAEEKTFILERFFDANWTNMIARFPRYQELLNKRGGTDAKSIAAAVKMFSEQDFRDLQIWFNLAWFDPQLLESAPLNALVEKGSGFSEADKQIVFNQVRVVMGEVVAIHKELQESGQIEVITTPYAHPILPLIYNTDLALTGNSSAEMPNRFSWPNDAIAQLERSIEIYEDHFGQPPNGLWPGEGAVAEEIVPLVNKAGYQWMATGEPVLAKSLGIGEFTRNGEDTVQEADALYRPYYVSDKNGGRVAIFFRDWVLSDLLGFEYSQTPGKEAAADLILRLENIKEQLRSEGAKGPHVVSIILDGENAWENYPNDGKEFLHEMYRLLGDTGGIETITPTMYLEKFPEQRQLDYLFPGAWFSANYDTWIGESEETLAWNYLGEVRDHLAKYDVKKQRSVPEEQLAEALDYMYLAEGSDWFWWFGADQDSGVDEYFDQGYRELLKKVYVSLGDPVPVFLDVPIIPKRPAVPSQSLQGLGTPVVDGVQDEAEWDLAAKYDIAGGTLRALLDQDHLYILLESDELAKSGEKFPEIYVSVPGSENIYPFAYTESDIPETQLGISASMLFMENDSKLNAYVATGDGWNEIETGIGMAASDTGVVELQIPLAVMGEFYAGDVFQFVVVMPEEQRVLLDGPVKIIVPDLGNATSILVVQDPAGDDHGPDSYTYPTDGVFDDQVFDIDTFSVSYDSQNIVFQMKFYGPVGNPWGSTIDLSVQTIDVYVDTDPGQGTGARMLLPGRNASLSDGDGWDIAVWVEGWYPDIFAPDVEGAPKSIGVTPKIFVDAAAQTVTIRVPIEVFGEGDPAEWGYAAVVMSQDGFPSKGVWRIRDVEGTSSQWRLGGGGDDVNHTRIVDLVWPADDVLTQEVMLGGYSPSSEAIDALKPDDFAQIELIKVE